MEITVKRSRTEAEALALGRDSGHVALPVQTSRQDLRLGRNPQKE